MLHGKERVVTEAEGRADAQSLAAVVDELRDLKDAMPRMIRDAVLLVAA
jgi:hypothetical protein